MMQHYCTYFDHRYLARGLAMIRSLRKYDRDAQIWVLCLSEECYRVMSELQEPGALLLTLADLEREDPALAATKDGRSAMEYYFTCTSALVCFVLKKLPENEIVTYLDGDLYFYSDPAPIYAELGNDSVGIIAHRFPENVMELNRFGVFNVGWVSFRNDGRGRTVAEWWRERCIEWCYDVLEDDRYADQKYLDRFSEFDGVTILNHPGANVAPWNLGRHRLECSPDGIAVDGEALIFFHFHGLRKVHPAIYLIEHHAYRVGLSFEWRKFLYQPYVRKLEQIEKQISAHMTPEKTILRRGDENRLPRLQSLFRTKLLAYGIKPWLYGHVMLVRSGRAY